jgi:RNA polymerase sigma factor (sigma-70 family)
MIDGRDMDQADETIRDELLAVRCQLGERAAFDALVERWHAPLSQFVRRLSGDDDAAADTVQEVWLRVVRGIARLRDPARLRAWLFGIARRAAHDRLRQRYAEPEALSLEDVEIAAPGSDFDLADDLDLMRAAVAGLPFTEREAVVLFYLGELTLTQMAEVLAIPVGTVKSRLFRARQMLRHDLLAKGVER